MIGRRFATERLLRIVLTGTALLPVAASAKPVLDGVLSNHAVVQRAQPLEIAGTVLPGETVSISFAGRTVRVTAGSDGRFRTRMPALPAGGPYDLIVSAPSGALVIEDLLVGDVFLCSGQSNMEMAVSDGMAMIPAARGPADPQLRLLTVPKAVGVRPMTRFDRQPEWAVATPDAVQGFSAACVYMAQAMRQSGGVPVGAIHSSWGGSRISAWLSDPALQASGMGAEAELRRLYGRDPVAANRQAAAGWEAWWRAGTGDRAGSEPWQVDAPIDWRPVPSIANFESWGVPELGDYNGMIWFRREVELTAEQARGPATLAIGRVDDADRTWVNGQPVGGSSLASELRVYSLASGTLKAGRNVISVNADDVYANGGLIGPADAMRLTLADGSSIPLGDGWRYAVAARVEGAAPRVPWGDINGAGTLFNTMIAPLSPLKVAGIAWYQGESDTGIPGYDRRMAALIADWRQRFGTPRTAVAIVQLSAYGTPPASPGESGWGNVRDAQRRVAAADPHVGLAVTHDIGDFTDIHPGQKYQVGLRLARAMQAAIDGAANGRAGPAIADARAMPDGGVLLRFDGVTGALHARSAAVAIGFELCGAAAGSCRWAAGTVTGDTVRLAGDGQPVTRVRYAWADAPDTNLSDDALLPVGSFEIALR